VRFHPAGDIDRVAPEIVAELVFADDAGHHWSGVQTDPPRVADRSHNGS
jgi:hypothetical protein